MNARKLTSALAIAALCVTGSAFATSNTVGGPSTTPSNTPNDSTATPPNTAVPAGTPSPAPTHSSNQTPASTTPTHPSHPKDGVGKAPSDMGNTNVSPTQAPQQGTSAPYTKGAK